MSKNIVIFADGTGQEGGVGHNTNVYDLFNMITDRTERQISYYDRGLGTGWTRLGMISGLGITKNIRECYQFLSDNYAAGDHIYLFGFSRGATTVRTLSAFVHLFGILPRSRPELIKKAWKIYQIDNRDRRRKKAKEFVQRNHTMWARVRFLGVWDTVAALGVPFNQVISSIVDQTMFRHSFHDLRLAKSVDYARHALAIDDERRIFHPKLWDERDEKGRRRYSGEDHPHFVTDDIEDVYLVVEKLKTKDHPVSSRLTLNQSRELIEDFDTDGGRNEPEHRIEELKRALVADLNLEVYNSDQALYDPSQHDEFDGIWLSRETRRRMSRIRGASRAELRWLDRMLLEDAYSLRPAQIPRVKQVWFAGMHTDVGGGYPENELAHIALVWMVREAMDVGLLLYPKHHVDLSPDARGKMHDSMAGIYRRLRRRWDREKNQGRSPLVHESVQIRNRGDDPLYEPWILKTKYEIEDWPERQRGSIQFDDHHLWRETFWGWSGAFAVPWSAVERIVCDEQTRRLVIHLKGPRPDITVRGCLPKNLTHLVSQLERRREHTRLAEEDERLRAQDERFDGELEALRKRVETLESEQGVTGTGPVAASPRPNATKH